MDGRERLMVAQCNYKENDKCLKEQFINRINGDIMTSKDNKKTIYLKILVKLQAIKSLHW